jgi:hypothetical protein
MLRPPRAPSHIPKLALALGVTFAAATGCSGPAFNSGEAPCRGSDCEGEPGAGSTGTAGQTGNSGGRAGAAGAPTGGAPSTAGAQSTAGKGGVGNSSGSPGMTAGAGGMPDDGPPAFPATDVLDRFSREGPELGISWIGAADDYSIKEQTLWCEFCSAATFWSTPFEAEQEVHATLKAFDAGAGEINLVLKAQNDPSCELIEVLFSPGSAHARISYCTEGMWTELGVTPVIAKPGDRLGGRALSNGFVEIYLNDQLVTTVDASGFPYELGRIGVNGVSGDNGLRWDDFGGGEWR